VDKESPEYIKQQVEGSFQVVTLNIKDPSRIRHPTKRNVKLIESFPLIPDLSAFPDAGGYVSIKFQTNPVPPSNVYDIRLDSGVLRPLHPSDERIKAREEAIAAHQRDPERNPFPEHEQDYEFFLVDTTKDALNFKRKYDLMDPERDSEDLYTHVNQDKTHCFRFKRIRAYETATTAGSQETKYDEEIVIAINDGRDGIHQRAAYYYPLVQRSTIRPQRKKNIDRQRWGFTDPEIDDPDSLDMLDITIRDPSEQEERERKVWIDSPYHQVDDPEDEDDQRETGDARAERQYQEDANAQLQHRDDEDLGSDN
jgi:RNA polymerase II-associated factor 1